MISITSREAHLMTSHVNNPAAQPLQNPVTPLKAAFDAIGGKWKLIIIYWLAESPQDFATLRSVIPGITPRVLTQQIGELMRDDIVRLDPAGDAQAIYALSDYGLSLLPLVESVRVWGSGHLDRQHSLVR